MTGLTPYTDPNPPEIRESQITVMDLAIKFGNAKTQQHFMRLVGNFIDEWQKTIPSFSVGILKIVKEQIDHEETSSEIEKAGIDQTTN